MRNILFGVLLVGSGHALAETCSIGSREGLLNYMQEFSTGFPAFSTSIARGYDSNANTRIDAFRTTVENCEATIQLRGLSGCFETANRLAQMNARRRGISGSKSQNMEMSDQEYYAQLPPELQKLPPELSNGLPANWRDLAAAKGWQAITYRSRTVPNPGPTRSYMRVLFKIPGNPIERWIQFTIGDLDNPTQPEQLIDAIAVNTQTKEISFNQFWRDENGKNPQPRSTGPHGSGGNMDSCISCHPNGMREISPAPGSFPERDAAVLADMNASMQNYKKLTWRGLDVDAYGPPLGQTDGCVRCHNGYTGDPAISRGALTVMTDQSLYEHKMLDDLSMSPTTLTSRDDALQYLKNIPLVLSEEERQRMMMDVYGGSGGSSFWATRKTLQWLRDNKDPSGAPYLTQSDHDRYLKSLSDMVNENEPLISSNSALTPGRASREETREWFLQGCEFPPEPALPPVQVVDGENAGEVSGTPTSGSGASNASQK